MDEPTDVIAGSDEGERERRARNEEEHEHFLMGDGGPVTEDTTAR